MFLVDMRTPGITVRPIPTMAGQSEFSEIFFDDVVDPRDRLLGDENDGWTLVGEGLAFERIGIARYARAGRIIELLVAYAARPGRRRRSPRIPRCASGWRRWRRATRPPGS